MTDEEQWCVAWCSGTEHAQSQLRATKRQNSVRSGLHAAAAGLQPGASGLLVAEGDSWFDYSVFTSILDLLEDEHSFAVEEVAAPGYSVGEMAYRDDQLDRFIRRIRKCLMRDEIPRAILLSGGGNDLAGPTLEVILNHRESGPNGLNGKMMNALIDQRIRLAYAHIVAAITSVCETLVGRRLPIVIHGYDYPIPDGRGGRWGRGGWLKAAFQRKGHHDATANKMIMRELIDDLNRMLGELSASEGAEHVHYVDLRNTLSTAEVSYRDHWDNELHPRKRGFRLLANKLAVAINSLPPA